MRDLLIIGLVLAGCLTALKKPWVGIMVWTWLSIMNPHRYAYGPSYDAPLAAMAAASTLVGFLASRDRESPFKGSPTRWLMAFVVWITVSWLAGLDLAGDYEQWKKVMKVLFMIFIGLSVLRTKVHIFALAWVATGSLALLGAKGGVFTLATGGNYKVWGPPGSFIEDNNEFALALVMTIPLLRFLQSQLTSRKQQLMLTGVMILCAASALGSYSRGALLALSSMALVLWWRGKSRILGGLIILVSAVALIGFLPDRWGERMSTIETFGEDRSALGRISAWWTAFGVATTYFSGAGFNVARADLFARFSPYPDYVHAAHSIYFQALGNHGFLGLFLFLAVFISTFRAAGQLRKDAANIPEAQWCDALGAMVQVSLIGYAVGGAFLSLCYFDLPYNILMLVVLSREWVRRRGWQTDPPYQAPKWRRIPGVDFPPAKA